ncbi:sugar-binding transcriptional regulator [Mobilicoccus pelagius]|uniref:Deoxyribonucleoside regulator n=1 Tax=Mobilicoccus pelagius NBRC 104925 TaxID=1089455 RepID=H5US40_9MICO|nr:sugar-binding transcriptional regulator [Mobilicoccus pelagius]GAB48548.1 deoxyribonucleoside regulator [Mobilicoccus pelagius NBRC 104925]
MNPRDEQALDAAKLYYRDGLSQGEVADRLGISRPTVSKLVQHAKDRGFVSIEIHDPRETGSALAERLQERFGLVEVRLAHTVPSGPALTRELGRLGAAVLADEVGDGDLVGVTWGDTMYAVARALTPQPRHGVGFVQLKGGLSLTPRSTNDVETMTLLCRGFDAYARMLPLPVIFDSAEVKRIVEQERHIRHILDLGREAPTAIFTVGATSPEAMLFNLGHLSEEERDALAARAVGDMCSRFFDEHGDIALPELDARTVGISLPDLRAKHTRILVAGGPTKTHALGVALEAGYATHLVTDAGTAGRILGDRPAEDAAVGRPAT